MPWCAICERYLAPPTVRPDGTCPTCDTAVTPAAAPASAARGTNPDEALPPLPWHFKALLVALAGYLGYRFWEMGAWLLRRL